MLLLSTFFKIRERCRQAKSFLAARAVFFVLICSCGICFAADISPQILDMSLQPLAFTANQGQWDDRVLFRANGGGATLWFTKEGITYQFTRRIPRHSRESGNPVSGADSRPAEMTEDSIATLIMSSTFIGANPNPVVRGEIMMEYKCNYFHGNDPTGWRTDVPNYEAIVISDIYSGIDLRFYGTDEKLEYDFIVAPGADYSQIQVQYDGAKSLTVDVDGNLVVETEWSTMTELSPIVYQQDNGQRREIRGSYELIGESGFAFQLADDYDPALAVFIDPVLTFSTYLGGASGDLAFDIAVNASGEAFLCGYTSSSDFPRVNPYDNTLNANEIFVTRFNAAGNGLVYSTFLGGSGSDISYALALFGDVAYLTGSTTSTDFPTVNAIDVSISGFADAFVAALGSAGNTLGFSTYLGGSSDDYSYDIALRCPFPCITPTLKVWVVGLTHSTNFPTINAFDATSNGVTDAFMVQYNLSTIPGNSLVFGTYLGGSGNDQASAIAIAGGTTLTPYITGVTTSTNFPMANAYDNSLAGTNDAFITSFGVAGNGQLYLLFSTYFGGNEEALTNDQGNAILARSSGNICIAGYTALPDWRLPERMILATMAEVMYSWRSLTQPLPVLFFVLIWGVSALMLLMYPMQILLLTLLAVCI